MSTTAETGGAVTPATATPPPAQTTPVVTTPAVTTTPVVPPVTTTPAVATPPVVTAPVTDPAEVRLTSAQLKERLAEERAKGEHSSLAATLKALGVEKLSDAKSRIDAALALEEAQKSELEKANAKAEKLKPRADRADALEASLTAYAAKELQSLTADQQAIVISLAGDDPDKRLTTIATLRPSWAKSAPPAVETTTSTTTTPVVTAPPVVAPPVTTTAPPLPPPASTAPASTAPPAAAGATTNHLATWETLKSQNPVRAAGYRAQFGTEIAAAEKARRG